MVIKIEIREGKLIGVDENTEKIVFDFGQMPEKRVDGIQMKWKDGSFLTDQQVTDGKYQIKNKIV